VSLKPDFEKKIRTHESLVLEIRKHKYFHREKCFKFLRGDFEIFHVLSFSVCLNPKTVFGKEFPNYGTFQKKLIHREQSARTSET